MPIMVGVGAGVGAVLGAAGGAIAGMVRKKRAKKLISAVDVSKALAEPNPRTSPAPPLSPARTPEPATTTSEAVTFPKRPSVEDPPPATTTASPPAVAKKRKGKHTVFDINTHYFTTNTEFYVMLSRFYEYVMFPEEKEAFAVAVQRIDNLLGLDILIHAREPMSKAAIPSIAQSNRNEALRQLKWIVENQNEQRPSTTKHEAMTTMLTDITTAMDQIVNDMSRLVALQPVRDPAK